MFIREAAKAIINDINNNPQNWNTDDVYIITNGKIEVWIKHGARLVGIWNDNKRDEIFNYFERRAIYKAYKNLINQREKAYKKRLSKKIMESLK
jgi:hypothetical protein